MNKRIRKTQRHILWNWEESTENNYQGAPTVRYHFVVVDDKNRDMTLNKILYQIQKESGILIPIRNNIEGKVKGCKLRYSFSTYDSNLRPSIIDFNKIGKTVKRDLNLKERKKGSIEDYIANKYEI